MVVLEKNRDQLYEELNDRVDAMISAGAIDEAKKVLEMIAGGKVAKSSPLLRAIGLKHLLQFLSGERGLDEAVSSWKRDTRRLAKRQWTWLRKFCGPAENVRWTHSHERYLEEIRSFLMV